MSEAERECPCHRLTDVPAWLCSFGGIHTKGVHHAADSPLLAPTAVERIVADRVAAVLGEFEGLATKWQGGLRYQSGPFVRGEGNCADDLRAVIQWVKGET